MVRSELGSGVQANNFPLVAWICFSLVGSFMELMYSIVARRMERSVVAMIVLADSSLHRDVQYYGIDAYYCG